MSIDRFVYLKILPKDITFHSINISNTIHLLNHCNRTEIYVHDFLVMLEFVFAKEKYKTKNRKKI